MSLRITFHSAFAGGFISFAAWLTPVHAVTLTVEGAATYAVGHNQALAAARYRIDEARGRLVGAGRLANPEAEFEFAQNPRSPERVFAIAWMQKFPITARLRLEKAVSRAELAAAEAEFRNAERKLAGEARAAAVKLLVFERARGLRAEQMTNSEELTKFMTQRVATGEGSAIDVAQVELESRQLSTQVLQLDAEKAAVLGELRPLLGIRANETVVIKGELADPAVLPSGTANVAARGDYRAAKAGLDAAQQSVLLARANKWEDVGVGFTKERAREEDAPEGFERETMVGVRVSVPLPIWNKNEGRIQEAEAAAKRAAKEIDAVALQIRAEVVAARDEMAALGRIVAQIDGKLIPQAKQIEEQLRSAYQTGQTPLPEVVRARGRRFDLEAQRLDALRDYHLARARYATAVGTISRTSRGSHK